jgi:hypothetical protein
VECLEDRALLSGVVNEVEFNGSLRAATRFVVPSDGLIQLQGTSVNGNDKDFFRFVAPQTGPLAFNVQATNGLFAQLEVQNRLGVGIAETDPNDGINNGRVDLRAGETYFIRMRSPGKTPAGYLVDLDYPGSSGGGAGGSSGGLGDGARSLVTEREVNDSQSAANVFGFDSLGQAELRGRAATSRDRDFFVFTAPRTGEVQVTVERTSGIQAKLNVERPGGETIFETQPNDGVNSGSFQVEAGQKYFVRLRSPAKLAAGYAVLLALS